MINEYFFLFFNNIGEKKKKDDKDDKDEKGDFLKNQDFTNYENIIPLIEKNNLLNNANSIKCEIGFQKKIVRDLNGVVLDEVVKKEIKLSGKGILNIYDINEKLVFFSSYLTCLSGEEGQNAFNLCSFDENNFPNYDFVPENVVDYKGKFVFPFLGVFIKNYSTSEKSWVLELVEEWFDYF